MKETTTVRRIGDSLGFLIPAHVADALALRKGDELHVTVTPDGLHATPTDPAFAAALEDARAFMQTHRDAFRELSK